MSPFTALEKIPRIIIGYRYSKVLGCWLQKAAMERSMSMFRNNCLESVHQTAVKIKDDDGDSCIWISIDAKRQ
jgi:hypothetical protein